MRFLLSEDHWALDSLFPGEWEWLSSLPRIAAGVDYPAKARERLYPSPLAPDELADENTISQVEDWEELIRPELETGFARDREIVATDLASSEILTPELFADDDPIHEAFAEAGFPDSLPEMRRVVVPHEHTEAWYSTLNQARLLLNEVHRLAESEERHLAKTLGPEAVGEERLLLIAQYELYSVVQSILVENLMDE